MQIGSFEITKREILFSSIILAVMIGIGVLISRPIIADATENALVVASSIQVKEPTKFDYIRRTDVGNFIAEGKLVSLDRITIPDIPGVYSKIEKVKQRYTQHTRTVTTTDSKGHAHTHTETYWSWDTIGREEWVSNRLEFLGVTFTPKSIGYRFPSTHHSTIKESSRIRYCYYTAPIEDYGTITGVATGRQYTKTVFQNSTIEKKVKDANDYIDAAPVVFWVLWILITLVLVFIFYYAENKWLY